MSTGWGLLLIPLLLVAPVTLPFLAFLWEKRLVWPYVPPDRTEGPRRGTSERDEDNPYAVGAAVEEMRIRKLDPYAARAIEAARDEGFAAVGIFADGTSRLYRIRYDFWLSSDRTVLALVTGGTLASIPCRNIGFFSLMADGHCLVTHADQKESELDLTGLNREALIPSGDFRKLLEKHRDRVHVAGVTPLAFSRPDPLGDLKAHRVRRVERLRELGLARYHDPERTTWRYTTKGALAVSVRTYLIGMRRVFFPDSWLRPWRSPRSGAPTKRRDIARVDIPAACLESPNPTGISKPPSPACAGETVMRTARAMRKAGDLLWRILLPALSLMVSPSCGPGTTPQGPPAETPADTPGASRRIERDAEAMIADLRALAADNNRFALDLFGRLRAGRPGNLLFSPGSLSTTLALAYAGARGQTADQMARVLHFRLPPERLHRAFGTLIRTWEGEGRGYRMGAANRLWGKEGVRFSPRFLAIAREDFGAEPAQVDFARQADRAIRRINDWVRQQTRDRIRELIRPGDVDATTQLVLTNAIHLKGEWTQPFQKEETRPAPFLVSEDRRVDVPLMGRMGDYRLFSGDGLKMLELPYGDGRLAMWILLPDAADGRPDLEAKLSVENLSRWQSGLRMRRVRVFLPRFKLTAHSRLAEILKSLGMTAAFTPGEADFSGIDGEAGPALSAVIHEALIDVNEEGTEATAATAGELKSEESIEEPAVFRADRPFLFLIRDDRTRSLLFLGRLLDPEG